MQGMRSHHDPQRVMLPLRELREHEWVFVITSSAMGLSVLAGIWNLKSPVPVGGARVFAITSPAVGLSEKPAGRIPGTE